MRWFFTEDPGKIGAALAALGETIIAGPTLSALVKPGYKAVDYKLAPWASAARADIVVLVNPLRLAEIDGKFYEVCFSRSFMPKLRRRRISAIMLSYDEPETWTNYRTRMAPGCAVQPHDVIVYATTNKTVLSENAKKRRAVDVGHDGASRLLDAVQHGRTGKSYSPKRDGLRWRQ